MNRIDGMLKALMEIGGSDLHLSAGATPVFRINGVLQKLRGKPIDADDAKDLLYDLLSEDEISRLEETKSIDFSYEANNLGRFRCNAYHHRKGLAAAFRCIPNAPPSHEALGLPPAVRALASAQRGLVIVTGPTGSGKSTTLAAMIHGRNLERQDHIITLEDPVEFIHEDIMCLIHQREIGKHAPSFSEGLRAALREDPDVLLVGEMRDYETISLALTAAETGLLVLGTLHTLSAAKAVDRIIDAYPASQHSQARAMLAESLRGVIAQVLVKKADGKGRVAGIEILVNSTSVSHLIREAKGFQIPSIIQTGRKDGMQLLDQHLAELVAAKTISPEQAMRYASNKSLFIRPQL